MTDLAEAVGVYKPNHRTFLTDVVGILNLSAASILCIFLL